MVGVVENRGVRIGRKLFASNSVPQERSIVRADPSLQWPAAHQPFCSQYKDRGHPVMTRLVIMTVGVLKSIFQHNGDLGFDLRGGPPLLYASSLLHALRIM